MKFFVLLLLFFAIHETVLAKEPFYVVAIAAQIKDGPSSSGKNLGQLKRGDKVFKFETEKMWSKITADSNKELSGWVATIMINKNPPIKSQENILGTEDISKNARKRASSASSAGAARGLTADSSKTLVKLPKGNYADLAKMVGLYVDPKEALDFVR